ncbi:MAG: histidine kinase [Bacteroidetes bacterium]|jgi:CHASE3 domain sensor protein|nr:histidine kinase [Bacteroidota bacterium]
MSTKTIIDAKQNTYKGRNYITIAALVIMCILLSFAILGYIKVRAVFTTNQKVINANRVLFLNQEINSQTKDVVIGTRGYVIAHDSSYIRPFTEGRKKIKIYFEEITNLTAADPEASTLINRLKKLVDDRITISFLIMEIGGKNDQKSTTAFKNVFSKANALMDDIRSTSQELQEKYEAIIKDSLLANESNLRNAMIIFIILFAFINVILFIIYRMFKIDITGRIKAESDLRNTNKNLETLVEARTQDLKRSYETLETKVTFRNLELEKLNKAYKEKIDQLEKRN